MEYLTLYMMITTIMMRILLDMKSWMIILMMIILKMPEKEGRIGQLDIHKDKVSPNMAF